MSEEKWKKLIEEFKIVGKSQRVWCQEKGIKRSTLRYWLEHTDDLSEGKEVRFARVLVGGEQHDRHQTV